MKPNILITPIESKLYKGDDIAGAPGGSTLE